MNFMMRPSKCFLFDVLEKRLKQVNGSVGLDAASAGFKNRRMFKTKKYYGLDINLEVLKVGLKKYNNNTFGILANLIKTDVLPDSSVDVLVSTNTLYCLSFKDRIIAINNLCNLVAPTGQFICDLVIDEAFEKSLKILKKYFFNLKIIYYKNIFSRVYESFFKKKGVSGLRPLANIRPFRLLAWLISLSEYLTCRFRKINKHALVICSDKKNKDNFNKFNLSYLPLIQDRLYNALCK